MANQAFSLSEDLMVGAGEVMFKRADDSNGWHTLGNVEEMSITVDVTKVEKNSSMNRKRTLMASVTTAVKPTATITLTEYNAYNLALGLYGREAIGHVDALEVVDSVYEVPAVPGIITLVDADGNRMLNVKDIAVKPITAIPAIASYVSVPASAGTITTGASSNDTMNDTAGGKLVLNAGTYSASSDVRLFIKITKAPTAVGNLDGMEIEVKEGITGIAQKFIATSVTTETYTLTSGATLTATVSTSDTFTQTPTALMIEAQVKASTSEYTAGRDFFYDTQSASGGIIKLPKGSAIHVGDQLKISYRVEEAEYINVSLADAGEIIGEFLYVADNNSGPNYVIEGWKVKVVPSGDMNNFIGSDFGSFQLTIEFIDASENHPDYPFAKVTAVSRTGGSEMNPGSYSPEW